MTEEDAALNEFRYGELECDVMNAVEKVWNDYESRSNSEEPDPIWEGMKHTERVGFTLRIVELHLKLVELCK